MFYKLYPEKQLRYLSLLDINNLHLVKKLINLNDLIEHYKEAFCAYYGDLADDEDRHREHAHHNDKIKDITPYQHPAHD